MPTKSQQKACHHAHTAQRVNSENCLLPVFRKRSATIRAVTEIHTRHRRARPNAHILSQHGRHTPPAPPARQIAGEAEDLPRWREFTRYAQPRPPVQ